VGAEIRQLSKGEASTRLPDPRDGAVSRPSRPENVPGTAGHQFNGDQTMHHQLKDLMTRDVKVISPDMSIDEAARTMRDGDFGMLPVGENDRMIGAISDRDIAIRAVAEGKGPDTKVREIMTEGICWAYDDDTVERAAVLMAEMQVRRLPVVDHDKRLVGIVALGDFAVDGSGIRPAAAALAKISEPS
jgi:CBS domain-containing protein